MRGILQDVTREKLDAQQLDKLNQQLIGTSRLAGMAEVATGVLHNVGNVLNSVSVSASLVTDGLRRSKVADLRRAAILLREHSGHLSEFLDTDPKGKLIPEFIRTVVDQVMGEESRLVAQMDSVGQHIEHIKEIVAMQQTYAKVSGVYESLAVEALVEDALRMNAAAFDRHGIELVRDFSENLPLVCVDRHKVLQILINLLSNAKYAMTDRGGDERHTDHPPADGRARPDKNHRRRQWHRDRPGKSHPDFQPWFYHQDGRAWLRPAQRRQRRQGNGRQPLGPQRGPGPGRRVYPGVAGGRRRPPRRTFNRLDETMKSTDLKPNHRILIVDDNASIHSDFRDILCPDNSGEAEVNKMKAALFGDAVPAANEISFELDSAFQGQEALELVTAAVRGIPAVCHGLHRRTNATRMGRHRNHRAHLGTASGVSGDRLYGLR